MLLTYQIKLEPERYPRLDQLAWAARPCVRRMLHYRTRSSSADYPEVPCVIAKSLIAKYQKNLRCRSVKNLVLPICGDRGRQVKLVAGGLRIPALFKKAVIPAFFPRPVHGFIRHVEFFQRRHEWYMSYAYDVAPEPVLETTSWLGVDRNSVGNVAVAANPITGLVRVFGPSLAQVKANFRCRRARLQRKGAWHALTALRRKQRNKTTYTNHLVSRGLVKLARATSSALVLEDLEPRRKGSKIRRYTEAAQWSYHQLGRFIAYKAALAGVPLHYINPRNTSRECSRCGVLNVPQAKRYSCSACGQVAHRDVNAAFVVAKRGAWANGSPNAAAVGSIDGALNQGTADYFATRFSADLES